MPTILVSLTVWAVMGELGRADRAGRLGADALLVGGVALALTLAISVAHEDGTRAPGAPGYLIGIAIAALLVARGRAPLGVVVVSIGLLFVYYSFDYPGFPVAVALAASAYFAAVAGRALASSLVLGLFLAIGVMWQWLGEGVPLLTVLGTHTLVDAAFLAAVLILGEAVRNRRALREEVQARLRRAERDRASESARRGEEERLRIARELHDVIAHTLAGVNVQAGVAAEVIADDTEQAREALRAIREQTREAIHELRATVALLRGGSAETTRAPLPGLRELDSLLQFANEAGLNVECSMDGEVRRLPSAVELAAYRIVQESLTNVVRHAGAAHARILLRFDPAALIVEVEDDGLGVIGGSAGQGHGLAGMRERAMAVGGTLEAGAHPAGGFRVAARLPLGERL